ncbi:MAG: hypothetical protein HOV79_19515 [Hamadaea sp.]|nr:hypothetical protein [Hamadaea sp.]
MLRTGWIPASVATAVVVATLVAYGTPFPQVLLHTAYLVVILTLPGMLIWRILRRGPGHLSADLAAGTAVGFVISLAGYLPARAAGVPMVATAPALAVLVAFAAVPRLRPHWRGSGERAPWWWSWSMSGAAVAVTGWSAISFFRSHALVWPGNATPSPDVPFQLGIAAELKHHVPGIIPFLQDEPLRYHWFLHAHLAATSWATGIELQTLLFRLAVLPLAIAMLVLVAHCARVVVGVWWAGPVAVVITLFAAGPKGSVPTGAPLGVLWLSPTQTAGGFLFAAVALLLVRMLRDGARGGEWALFALLIAGVAGAKATFLPLLVAALILVAVVRLFTKAGDRWVPLTALGITVAILLAASAVLFSGSTTGLTVDPLGSVRRPGQSTGAGLVRYLFGWLVAWAGLAGLLIAWRKLADPALLFCLGLGAAAMGAVLSTTQSGQSQYYFLTSARPYLSIAATAGVAALLTVRSWTWRRITAVALLGVMLAYGASNYRTYAVPLETSLDKGFRKYPRAAGQIPAGGVEAARWLRDNSSPDDLVATNVHCRMLPGGRCDNRSFWVAGYAERRMLLEGWAYSPTWYAMAEAAGPGRYQVMPYWKPEVLAENDAAFTTPNAETLNLLRDKYGVRWLYVDERLHPDTAALEKHADLRHSSGDAAVYELR